MELYDLHCHSIHSYDGKDTVKRLCQSAIRTTLKGIAITDHCDFGNYQLPDWEQRLEKSLQDIEESKEIFDGRLQVFSGVELGQIDCDYTTAQKIYHDPRVDFALASVHYLEGIPSFYSEEFTQIHPEELLELYFTQLYTISCLQCFDSLAHLTYPLRFFHRHGLTIPDLHQYDEILVEIFRELATSGKALELNIAELSTSGLTSPPLRELKLFRQMGGEYVTIGSDCHNAKTLGLTATKGHAILRMAGFEHQTLFTGHKPKKISLI